MLKMISMILVGFINRVTSNELPRIDWGGSGFEKKKKRIPDARPFKNVHWLVF